MYRVKKVGNRYKIYNTKRKAYLKKKYSDRASANRGKSGLLKRIEGVKAYHNCCRSNNCGKSGRNATNNTTNNNRGSSRASSRASNSSSSSSSSSNSSRNSSRSSSRASNSSRSNSRASNSGSSSRTTNINRRREEQSRPTAATQDMLSELDRIADTIRTPSRPPRPKNRRRIRPIPMTSDFGVESPLSSAGGTAGQRRTANAIEALSRKASRMDRLMSGIVFTT
jgi:hypothetical protein